MEDRPRCGCGCAAVASPPPPRRWPTSTSRQPRWVLEHWTVTFAVREVIANALDEAVLTGTADPDIFHDDADARLVIR
jgi:hypothetical protein